MLKKVKTREMDVNIEMTMGNNESSSQKKDDKAQKFDEECKQSELILNSLQKARQCLYLSHFFAHFSENYWEFSILLFLSAITNFESILYVSTFGLCLNLGTFFVTPWLGNIIDKWPGEDRLRIIRYLIGSKHLTVMLALIFSLVLILVPPFVEGSTDDTDSTSSLSSNRNSNTLPTNVVFALIGVHILGTVAKILDHTFNIVIERDLIVILSQYSVPNNMTNDHNTIQSEWLSKTNSTMKQISLIAPFMITFLIFKDKLQYTCLLVGLVALISWIIEVFYITNIFHQIHILRLEQIHSDRSSCLQSEFESTTLDDRLNAAKQEIQKEKNVGSNRWAIVVYFEQPGSMAGISYALLFANSVTMGNGIFTGYLLDRGLAANIVGILRGISSAIGLLGTIAYTLSLRRYSLEMTGVWGVGWQAFCLAISTIFIALSPYNHHSNSNPTFLYISIASACTSRLGLYVFDIAFTQLQQQEIPEQYRCLIGGTQEALNAFCTLIAFGLCLLFPYPNDFIYISTSGCISVALAFSFFLFGIYLPRRNISQKERIGSRYSIPNEEAIIT